jgi:serine protease AprX
MRLRAVCVLAGIALAIPAVGHADKNASSMAHVIVLLAPGATVAPGKTLASVGGRLDKDLPVVNGFSGYVPAERIADLAAVPGIVEVTQDAVLNNTPSAPVLAGKGDATGFVDGDFAHKEGGASFPRLDLDAVNRIIGADDLHKQGVTGAGIDVALIDSGVANVPGIGPVVNGPDLSFDSQQPGFEHLDAYGHGTHLAGIINGSGAGVNGIAPGARIVNVKVGAANGAVDVSQVIAGIDWVVQHRNDNGLNIRVITLAYGTDGVQPYQIDPLAYAAEVAWRHGIVVVVAAGNRGSTAASLDNPATDPYLIAVGATEPHGTFSTADDTVASFSSVGNIGRGPDVVAPGRSVVSLRDPGSFVDLAHPEGLEPDGLLRGSGTSQATAVVAGSVALLLQAQPGLSPDQVKWLLRKTAQRLPFADDQASGAGEMNVRRAATRAAPGADRSTQAWPIGNGTGSLEAARGSVHVVMSGVPLAGEFDIFGSPWDGQSWSGQSWSGVSWSGGSWNGQSWSGQSWSGQSWSGQSWSGVSWSGQSWSGVSWSGQSWSGQSWSGVSWSGVSWSGVSWSGVSWSGVSWSGQSWSGLS